MDTWGSTPGLPDEAFEHDGLITKRHQRASALAMLRPLPGQMLWDVGAGSGSLAIEWCRAARGARAVGLERDSRRAERARENAERLAPGQVEVRVGDATDLLAQLPAPDAVFIGGGTTSGVLDSCWAALPPSGRIVAHGVTVETEGLLVDAYRTYGGELVRLGVEVVEPLGRFLGWTPSRAVIQWSCSR